MQTAKSGSHSIWDCKYHIVWVTKYRYPVLVGDVGLRQEMNMVTVIAPAWINISWLRLISRNSSLALSKRTTQSRLSLPTAGEKFRSYAWLWSNTFPLAETRSAYSYEGSAVWQLRQCIAA